MFMFLYFEKGPIGYFLNVVNTYKEEGAKPKNKISFCKTSHEYEDTSIVHFFRQSWDFDIKVQLYSFYLL